MIGNRLKYSFGLPFVEKIEDFDCISLICTSRDVRIDTIEEYVRYNNFVGVIVIDVVSDIVEDFNNSSDTQNFFDKANQLISDLDISFLFIIHENPNVHDKKARGHLGTESRNKASVTISISSMKDDKIKIEYLKTRHEKLPEPFYMCYDDESRLLKHCSIAHDETEEQIDNIIQSSYPRIEKDELFMKISEIINCKDSRTITKRIKKYFSVPFALHGKEYTLKRIGSGSNKREFEYVEYPNNK